VYLGFYCGSWLASDGGLPADQSLSDEPHSPVGAGLPAMAACQPTNILLMYKIQLWEWACPGRRSDDDVGTGAPIFADIPDSPDTL
jgi:hypothetical protein